MELITLEVLQANAPPVVGGVVGIAFSLVYGHQKHGVPYFVILFSFPEFLCEAYMQYSMWYCMCIY
jgi:hypothetical protein